MKWFFNLMIGALLFFPEKDFYALPRDFGLFEQEIFLTTRDGVRLHGWFFEAPTNVGATRRVAPTLLFFHGNAGNISGRLSKIKGWFDQGFSVFLVDYRSYGKSGGKIKKGADLLEDAEAALRWLEEERKTPSERIVLYGESLGSYAAIHLAGKKKFAGLVLEAPFTSLLELARKHYGAWIPEMMLQDFPLKNEDKIREVKAPVFVLHGDQDEICPVEMGGRLYGLAPAPKEYYVVQGGRHNDLPEVAGNAYVTNPIQFILRENGLV